MSYVRLSLLFFGCVWVCAAGYGISGAQAQDLASPPPGSALSVDRLIIKFRRADTDPSHAEYLERLFRDTGVRLAYVRPLAGGAHLLQIQRPPEDASLESVLERLGRHPDVQYVEPDRRMHHMK